jgi:hypothetical protein
MRIHLPAILPADHANEVVVDIFAWRVFVTAIGRALPSRVGNYYTGDVGVRGTDFRSHMFVALAIKSNRASLDQYFYYTPCRQSGLYRQLTSGPARGTLSSCWHSLACSGTLCLVLLPAGATLVVTKWRVEAGFGSPVRSLKPLLSAYGPEGLFEGLAFSGALGERLWVCMT